MSGDDTDWPAHADRVVPWQQKNRSGTRDDRMLREITVSMPPLIADIDLQLEPAIVAQLEAAVREITILDHTHAHDLTALSRMLLRTESVASSKIEDIEASVSDYARALHGNKSNASAVSMVAATVALDNLVHGVDAHRPITLGAILDAHAALMADDKYEGAYAGRLREVQNWIGGSDHSPRGALHIPPPAATVDGYMQDLLVFANRSDMPVLAQAAIAHAQFESIHPFTDSNGRIGRALINAILRRRGATTRVVIPLASALVAQKERYFDLLAAYRRGETVPLITSFASASSIAAQESQVTATRLAQFPADWAEQLGTVRRGSAVEKLLGHLAHHPVINTEDAIELVDASRSSVFGAVGRLVEAGILVSLTARKRDQTWGVQSILNELDDLSVRIGIASRP